MAIRRSGLETTAILQVQVPTAASMRRRMTLARSLMLVIAALFVGGTVWFAVLGLKSHPVCLHMCTRTPHDISGPVMFVLCVLPALHAAGWYAAYKQSRRGVRVVRRGVALSVLPAVGTVLGFWGVVSLGTSTDGSFAVAVAVMSAVPVALAVVLLRMLRTSERLAAEARAAAAAAAAYPPRAGYPGGGYGGGGYPGGR